MSLTNERNQVDFDGGHFHSLSVANGYLRPAPLSAVCEAVEEAEVVAVAKARSHIFHGILVWSG